MTLPIVERLRRYLKLAEWKADPTRTSALVPVLPRDLREAADTIETLYEALKAAREELYAKEHAAGHMLIDYRVTAQMKNALTKVEARNSVNSTETYGMPDAPNHPSQGGLHDR